MKKIILGLSLVTSAVAFGQSIVGSYDQSALIAPNQVKNNVGNVVITRDAKLKNRIWVNNLISHTKFYAVSNARTEDREVYSVPPQNVGGYAVKLGCLVYDNDDQRVTISLNNSNDCKGIAQSDYGKVSVSSKGISAGGVKVGAKGIKTDGVSVSSKGVSVNSGKLLEGVQYIGEKN